MFGRKVIIRAAVLALALPASLAAEDLLDGGAFMSGSHFFMSLVAGVVLAIAFQVVLTHLSLAAGLSAVSADEDGGSRHAGGSSSQRLMRQVRKLGHAFGVWTLLTATVALFFAAWLAVELSLTPDLLVGAVLGLVIWGLFYLVMMFVEASAVSSLVGALYRVAAGGLRGIANAAGSVFGKSDEQRVADLDATLRLFMPGFATKTALPAPERLLPP